MNISKVTPTSEKLVDEHYYFGTIDHEEVHQLRQNPREFLKRANVDLADDAEIKVSVEELGVRTLAQSRKAGTRTLRGGEIARATMIRRAMLCRVTVVIIDGIAIVHVHCIPIVVIACW